MNEEAKIQFTITVEFQREDGGITRVQLGTWTAALVDRPKMLDCDSRTPSKFSVGYKKLSSANNCSVIAKPCRRVLGVIVSAT